MGCGGECFSAFRKLSDPIKDRHQIDVDDRFTFADINLMPILYRARQFPESAEALAAATHLAGYYDRHAARPSFVNTIPPSGAPSRSKAN